MMISKMRFFFCIENEEKWLNQMADDGFRFIGKRRMTYDFVEDDKNHYRYFLDQRFFLISDKSYRDFMSDLKLKFVKRQYGKYYFEADSSCDITDFYTDEKAKRYFYLRHLIFLICVGLINILVLINAKGPYLIKIYDIFSISIPFVVNAIMLCGVIVAVYHYVKCIVNIKNDMA